MLVTAVALINPSGSVLMQRRSFSAVHGGLWEFPGGKVEPGENPEFSAIREMREELDLCIVPGALEPVGFASGLTAGAGEGGKEPRRPLVILLYACRAWQGTPRLLEAAEIGWYRPAAIAGLAMPPLDYPLAAALVRHLGEHSGPHSDRPG